MLTKSHFHILDSICALDIDILYTHYLIEAILMISLNTLKDWMEERDEEFRLRRKPSLNKIEIQCMIYLLVKRLKSDCDQQQPCHVSSRLWSWYSNNNLFIKKTTPKWNGADGWYSNYNSCNLWQFSTACPWNLTRELWLL